MDRTQIVIDASELNVALDAISYLSMKACAHSVGALQLEQVHKAFREGGQPSRKWPRLSASVESFRYGGQPLRDIGLLESSFFIFRTEYTARGMESTIACSAFYGPYQQQGFTTRVGKLYFIPLSIKGRRMHVRGANPRKEGLVPGKDFVVVKGGFSIPPRPMIDYSDPVNVTEISKTIEDVFS